MKKLFLATAALAVLIGFTSLIVSCGSSSPSSPSATATPTVGPPTATPTFSYTTSFTGSTQGAGMAFSTTSSGTLYMAGNSLEEVFRFSLAGTAGSSVGTGTLGTANGQFNENYDVAADSSGNVYATDTDNNRVQMFNASAVWQWTTGGTATGTGNGQFNFPDAIALDNSGNVYVADDGNSRVEILNASTGAYISQWTNANFYDVTGMAVDSANGFLYANHNGGSIDKFTLSGTFLTSWPIPVGGNFATIAIQPGTGTLFVSDTTLNRVDVYTSSGTFIDSIGSLGSGNGQFASSCPAGLTFDSNGNLYVNDAGNNRVEVFTP
jgi:sugar lactone lactonase YvrE